MLKCMGFITVGLTALHNAAFRGHTEIVEFLVSSGSNLEVKDDDGETICTVELSIYYASK